MDFISHRVITLIKAGMSTIQHISLFGVYLFVSLKKWLENVIHEDIIKAKEVYNQLVFWKI